MRTMLGERPANLILMIKHLHHKHLNKLCARMVALYGKPCLYFHIKNIHCKQKTLVLLAIPRTNHTFKILILNKKPIKKGARLDVWARFRCLGEVT